MNESDNYILVVILHVESYMLEPQYYNLFSIKINQSNNESSKKSFCDEIIFTRHVDTYHTEYLGLKINVCVYQYCKVLLLVYTETQSLIISAQEISSIIRKRSTTLATGRNDVMRYSWGKKDCVYTNPS